MKATGIVRRIDELGRIVIPREFFRTHGLNFGDPMEIFVDGERIVLKKYAPGCKLCGSIDDITSVKGNLLCKPCVTVIAESAGVPV